MDSQIKVLAQVSSGSESDWTAVYEEAFKKDERMPVEEIRNLIGKGTMVLHRTLSQSDELLCFSLTMPTSDFTLLSYIASNPSIRSKGVGSKHLKRLIELHKVNIFLEIESTMEEGLSEEELRTRKRRLKFYEDHGAKRLCMDYYMPSMTAGGTPHPGELLWHELPGKPVDDVMIVKVIREIYEKAYKLPANDKLLKKVLDQFPADIVAGTVSLCECEQSPSCGAGAAGDKPADEAKTEAPQPAPAAQAKTEVPQPAPVAEAKTGVPPPVTTADANSGSAQTAPAAATTGAAPQANEAGTAKEG